jgi:hypothetical protein
MQPEELTTLGQNLEEALKDAAEICALPSDATALRPAK